MTENQKKAIKELNRLQYIEEISDDIYFLLLGFVVEEKETKYVPIPEVTTPYPVTYTSTTTCQPEPDLLFERLPDQFGFAYLARTAKEMTGEEVSVNTLNELLHFWTEEGRIEAHCDGSYNIYRKK